MNALRWFKFFRNQLLLPFNMALLMWEAALWITENPWEALKLYHGMVEEVMDLLDPQYPDPQYPEDI